jgi:hypothetical protein
MKADKVVKRRAGTTRASLPGEVNSSMPNMRANAVLGHRGCATTTDVNDSFTRFRTLPRSRWILNPVLHQVIPCGCNRLRKLRRIRGLIGSFMPERAPPRLRQSAFAPFLRTQCKIGHGRHNAHERGHENATISSDSRVPVSVNV